jgi:hypothetical protein
MHARTPAGTPLSLNRLIAIFQKMARVGGAIPHSKDNLMAAWRLCKAPAIADLSAARDLELQLRKAIAAITPLC